MKNNTSLYTIVGYCDGNVQFLRQDVTIDSITKSKKLSQKFYTGDKELAAKFLTKDVADRYVRDIIGSRDWTCIVINLLS